MKTSKRFVYEQTSNGFAQIYEAKSPANALFFASQSQELNPNKKYIVDSFKGKS